MNINPWTAIAVMWAAIVCAVMVQVAGGPDVIVRACLACAIVPGVIGMYRSAS